MTRDTSADRRRRTIEAPNGVRVVMPPGTTDSQLIDQLLKWYYVPAFTQVLEVLANPPRFAIPPLPQDKRYTGRSWRFAVKL